MKDNTGIDELQSSISNSENDEPVQVVDKRRLTQVATEPAVATESARYPSYVEELQARLKQTEEQAEKMQARFKQLQADLIRETDELRVRLQRNAEIHLETAKAEMLNPLLDIVDNLARATACAQTGADKATLLAGVQATHTLLLRQLEVQGVKPLLAENEVFDPKLHEAVDTIEVEPAREGRVIKVYKPGYRLGERLLRPAMVCVGRLGATSLMES